MKNILDENPINTDLIVMLEEIKGQLHSESLSIGDEKDNDKYWVKSVEGYHRQHNAELKIAKILEDKFPHNDVTQLFKEYAQDSLEQMVFLKDLSSQYLKEGDVQQSARVIYNNNIIQELSSTIKFCKEQQTPDSVLERVLSLESLTGEILRSKITELVVESVGLLGYNQENVAAIYRDFAVHSLISNVPNEKDQEGERLLRALISHMLKDNNG